MTKSSFEELLLYNLLLIIKDIILVYYWHPFIFLWLSFHLCNKPYSKVALTLSVLYIIGNTLYVGFPCWVQCASTKPEVQAQHGDPWVGKIPLGGKMVTHQDWLMPMDRGTHWVTVLWGYKSWMWLNTAPMLLAIVPICLFIYVLYFFRAMRGLPKDLLNNITGCRQKRASLVAGT